MNADFQSFADLFSTSHICQALAVSETSCSGFSRIFPQPAPAHHAPVEQRAAHGSQGTSPARRRQRPYLTSPQRVARHDATAPCRAWRPTSQTGHRAPFQPGRKYPGRGPDWHKRRVEPNEHLHDLFHVVFMRIERGHQPGKGAVPHAIAVSPMVESQKTCRSCRSACPICPFPRRLPVMIVDADPSAFPGRLMSEAMERQ